MSDSSEMSTVQGELPDGLFVLPSFLSDQEVQWIMDTVRANEDYWFYDGFEKPRRVQQYTAWNHVQDVDQSRQNMYCDITSLDWLIDKFIKSTNLFSVHDQLKQNFVRPMTITIEERIQNSHRKAMTPVENLALSRFEYNASSKCLCQQTFYEYPGMDPLTDNRQHQSNDHCHDQDRSCNCYVAHITLLQPCIQYMNKPKERHIECWELETTQTKNPLHIPMVCNSLVVKTRESLWKWRYHFIPFHNESNSPSFISEEKDIHCSSSNSKDINNTRLLLIKLKCMNVPSEKSVGKMYLHRQLHPQSIEAHSALSNTTTDYKEMDKPKFNLADLLTIVITTSPIKSHPSTELLEKTFGTFPLAGDEFAYQCPKVIICDGCRILNEEDEETDGFDDHGGGHDPMGESQDGHVRPSVKSKKIRTISRKYSNVKQSLRNGIVTNEQAENYQKFKIALRTLCLNADSQESNCVFQNTRIVGEIFVCVDIYFLS